MSDWITKPESIIGILGTVGTLVGLWLALRPRHRKAITYLFQIHSRIFSNELIFINGGLDLRLNGKPVRELCQLELFISNKGSEVIRTSDLLRPMRLKFNKKVNIFPISITRQRTDIATSYDVLESDGKTCVDIKTDLIEPGDTITVNVIYEADSMAESHFDIRVIGAFIQKGRSRQSGGENFRSQTELGYANSGLGLIFMGISLAVAFAVNALLVWLLPSFFGPLKNFGLLNFLLVLFISSFCMIVEMKLIIPKLASRDVAEYERKTVERERLLKEQSDGSQKPPPQHEVPS